MSILHRLLRNARPRVADTERELLRIFGLVRPPVAVQWISTTACELTCPHCYSHAGRRAHGELTAVEAKRLIIDELVKLDRPTFVIAGGEALLRRDLPEIVAYAHRRRVPWALHSHGGRIEQLINLFEQCPPVMVAISLDGPRAYHDTFRGRVGSFDAALGAIRALKRIGCREVVAGTTVNRQNADLVADLFPIVLTSGADSWGLHLVTPEGRLRTPRPASCAGAASARRRVCPAHAICVPYRARQRMGQRRRGRLLLP